MPGRAVGVFPGAGPFISFKNTEDAGLGDFLSSLPDFLNIFRSQGRRKHSFGVIGKSGEIQSGNISGIGEGFFGRDRDAGIGQAGMKMQITKPDVLIFAGACGGIELLLVKGVGKKGVGIEPLRKWQVQDGLESMGLFQGF